MNAIRQFIEVKDNSFRVSLPQDFNAKSVEVIIIPNENDDFFELSDEQKETLEKALEQDKRTFISRDDISRKYKL
jgi:galactose-1-phosphate uridylyltransferase